MATALDIVTRALRKINVVAIDEEASADESAEALDAMNAMMHGWKARNADTTHTTLALADDFPLNPEYEEPAIILLADKLAGDYGVSPPNQRHVKDAWDAIRAAFMTVTELSIDGGLLDVSSQIGRANSKFYFG